MPSNDELAKEIESLKKELAALKAQSKPAPEVPKDQKPWSFRYDPTEGMSMAPEALKKMVDIVPDVKPKAGFDATAWARGKVASPSGFGPEVKPQKQPERGSGYQKERFLEPPRSGIRYVDAICDHFAAIDKAEDATKRIAAAVLGQKIK